MYVTEFYAWMKEKKTVEHLDKVIYIICSKRILDQCYGTISEKVYEAEGEKIFAVREILGEYVKEKLGKPFTELECREVTSEFVEGYKNFLRSKFSEDKKKYNTNARMSGLKLIFDYARHLKIADIPYCFCKNS